MDQHPHLVTSFRPLGLFTQDLSRGTKQSGVIIRPHRHWGVRDEKNPRARIEAKRAEGSDEVRMLIHSFSNGGAANARHLFNTMRDMNGGKLSIPRHILVLDSGPGYFHWSTTYNAMAAVTPRWTHPLIHIWILIGYVFWYIPDRPHYCPMNVAALRKDDLLGQEAARLYLYGTEDEMVLREDVEDDAEWISKKGGVVVRKEKFEGSKHVSHARTDFERYWGAVSNLWEERDVK